MLWCWLGCRLVLVWVASCPAPRPAGRVVYLAPLTVHLPAAQPAGACPARSSRHGFEFGRPVDRQDAMTGVEKPRDSITDVIRRVSQSEMFTDRLAGSAVFKGASPPRPIYFLCDLVNEIARRRAGPARPGSDVGPVTSANFEPPGSARRLKQNPPRGIWSPKGTSWISFAGFQG